jgi:hypothetical protein
MEALIKAHAENVGKLRAWEDYMAITGRELAKMLNIGEKALRQRVSRFRKKVTGDFLDQLRRVVNSNDIIENLRGWKGYRLNPRTVHVFQRDALVPSKGLS